MKHNARPELWPVGVIGVGLHYVNEREVATSATFRSTATAFFAAIGIIHAYELAPGGAATRLGLFAAREFTVSYVQLFALFFVVAWWERQLPEKKGQFL